MSTSLDKYKAEIEALLKANLGVHQSFYFKNVCDLNTILRILVDEIATNRFYIDRLEDRIVCLEMRNDHER
jgi:hypothetical protein